MSPVPARFDPARGLASCAVAVNRAGPGVAILPAGEFRANDGRPAEVPAWRLDAPAAARLIAQAQAAKRALLIDYEHQTLLAADNGQPAPAAGWLDPFSLSFEPGVGLRANSVDWTDRAAAMLEAGEYRYLSPVFTYDPASGEVTRLLHLALTNDPALDHGAEILAAASRLIVHHPGSLPPEETTMALSAAIRTALGLPEDATEESAVAAVAALQAQAQEAGEQVAALTAARPDPAKFVPVEAVDGMRQELAALTADIEGRERAALLAAGLADGRILPAMQTWAEGLETAALRRYLDAAQPVAALKGTQTGGKGPDAAPASPDDAATRAAAEWDASAALKAEISRDGYIAFARAKHAGLIRQRQAAA